MKLSGIPTALVFIILAIIYNSVLCGFIAGGITVIIIEDIILDYLESKEVS